MYQVHFPICNNYKVLIAIHIREQNIMPDMAGSTNERGNVKETGG